MMKIVVGGQIDKEDIAAIIKTQLKDQAEVTVKGDLDATMGMKSGQYDYYLGALQHGWRRSACDGACHSWKGRMCDSFYAGSDLQ